jgi:hypothetical protein
MEDVAVQVAVVFHVGSTTQEWCLAAMRARVIGRADCSTPFARTYLSAAMDSLSTMSF